MTLIKKIDRNLYYIDELLTEDDYISIMEEFIPIHNNIQFIKKDSGSSDRVRPGMGLTYPKWGEIIKNCDGQGIGDNITLIRVGEIIKYQLQKIIKRKVSLHRINTNIQFPLQEGTFHTDGGQNCWSVVLFVCAMWDPQWGGDFICLSDGDYISLPYKPNGGVILNAAMHHRGSAPNYFAPIERVSVAWTYHDF